MVDYYSILLRAVTAPGAGDAHWRRGIYDRSRQMLATRMRSLEPPAPLADIAGEEARLEAAIERIESELSWTEEHAVQKPRAPMAPRATPKPRAPGRLPSLQESLKPESLKPESLNPSSLRPGSKPDARPGSRPPSKPAATPSFKPTAKPAWTNHAAAAPADDEQYAGTSDDYFATDSEPGWSPRNLVLIGLAVVVAALGAGGYLFLSGKGQKSAPAQQAQKAAAPSGTAAKTTAATSPAATASGANAAKLAALNYGKNGELAPGVDGGSSDPDLQYVFRRQPTFYRTLQPVGTVIIDKGQHFLYLIQPNNVALRYGIAVGDQCSNLAGMRHISHMAEWPAWQPPPEMLRSNPTPLPGGPGNPLGARVMQLDDGNSRINGTNAPKTIGNPVNFGCIRLNNDDVTDLYGRVKLSTPVVVN